MRHAGKTTEYVGDDVDDISLFLRNKKCIRHNLCDIKGADQIIRHHSAKTVKGNIFRR
ncbi:hypothetical protein D3C83_246870 [compost metagenome]